MIQRYNTAVAAVAEVLAKLRKKLDAARTAGIPASAIAALEQAVTGLTEELRAVTVAQQANAENLARVQAIGTRARTALAAADAQVAVGGPERTTRIILSTGIAVLAVGGIAWGLWAWTQRDRY